MTQGWCNSCSLWKVPVSRRALGDVFFLLLLSNVNTPLTMCVKSIFNKSTLFEMCFWNSIGYFPLLLTNILQELKHLSHTSNHCPVRLDVPEVRWWISRFQIMAKQTKQKSQTPESNYVVGTWTYRHSLCFLIWWKWKQPFASIHFSKLIWYNLRFATSFSPSLLLTDKHNNLDLSQFSVDIDSAFIFQSLCKN